MTSPDNKSGLPHVDANDIAAAFGEDAANPDQLNRWTKLSQSNAILAFEIRDRAYTEATLSGRANESSDQIAHRMIDTVTYVLDIIAHGIERERVEEVRRTTELHFSDGDDGVSQPL